MTQGSTPDNIVSAVLGEFFKQFPSPEAPKAPTEPAKNAPTGEKVYPLVEVIRVLRKIEESANTHEQLLDVADRYLTLGEIMEKYEV